MPRFSEKLAEKKLVVVTGKGGAGKSALSLALSCRFAKEGKKVWLVEIGRRRDKAFSRLSDLLGTHVDHAPTNVTLGDASFQASLLDPTKSLAEYVDLKLPTGGLAGILLNNRVTTSFLEVVPGLPDLVAIGKLWHSVQNAKGTRPDIVILDAPATGHAYSLLRSPENFKRITRMGPIHKDAAQMVDFLQDKEKTAVVLTTLPEEMALQESADAKKVLKEFKTFIYVNKCFPRLPKLEEQKTEGILWQAYAYSQSRNLREQKALASFELAHEEIPFFFDPALSIYEHMEAAL